MRSWSKIIVSGLLEAALVAVIIMQGNRQLGDRGGNYPASAFNAYTAPAIHAGIIGKVIVSSSI